MIFGRYCIFLKNKSSFFLHVVLCLPVIVVMRVNHPRRINWTQWVRWIGSGVFVTERLRVRGYKLSLGGERFRKAEEL
jgi:hypothetical protein